MAQRARPDQIDRSLALIDRARAVGLTLSKRGSASGLFVTGGILDPDLRRELSACCEAIRAALRAEKIAKDAVRRAARPIAEQRRNEARLAAERAT